MVFLFMYPHEIGPLHVFVLDPLLQLVQQFNLVVFGILGFDQGQRVLFLLNFLELNGRDGLVLFCQLDLVLHVLFTLGERQEVALLVQQPVYLV